MFSILLPSRSSTIRNYCNSLTVHTQAKPQSESPLPPSPQESKNKTKQKAGQNKAYAIHQQQRHTKLGGYNVDKPYLIGCRVTLTLNDEQRVRQVGCKSDLLRIWNTWKGCGETSLSWTAPGSSAHQGRHLLCSRGPYAAVIEHLRTCTENVGRDSVVKTLKPSLWWIHC